MLKLLWFLKRNQLNKMRKERLSHYMKKVRKIDVLSVAVGAIIGWGCFVMPGNSFLPAAGPLGTLIGMTLAGIMAWIIAQSYSYLLVKYPVEGGEFEYVTQAFGKTHSLQIKKSLYQKSVKRLISWFYFSAL